MKKMNPRLQEGLENKKEALMPTVLVRTLLKRSSEKALPFLTSSFTAPPDDFVLNFVAVLEKKGPITTVRLYRLNSSCDAAAVDRFVAIDYDRVITLPQFKSMLGYKPNYHMRLPKDEKDAVWIKRDPNLYKYRVSDEEDEDDRDFVTSDCSSSSASSSASEGEDDDESIVVPSSGEEEEDVDVDVDVVAARLSTSTEDFISEMKWMCCAAMVAMITFTVIYTTTTY